MKERLKRGSKDELTVILHRSTVHTASQPWFLTEGWCPASVTVAVTVAVTHLHTKQHLSLKREPMEISCVHVLLRLIQLYSTDQQMPLSQSRFTEIRILI